MDYIEIEQDDLTDSQMLDVIREKMADGWALADYKYDSGIKVWVFERPKINNWDRSRSKDRNSGDTVGADYMGINPAIMGGI